MLLLFNYSSLLLLLSLSAFLFSIFFPTHAFATPIYNAHYCANHTTYQPNSTFQRNLRLLLSSLTSNASQDATGGSYTIDAVNGLFFCRGDTTAAACYDCVAAAAKEIILRCPNQTEAVIWYDVCTLRFTNRSFRFDSVVPGIELKDEGNVSSTEINGFNQTVLSLLDNLTTAAANSPTVKNFATGESEMTKTMRVYGVAQCTQALTTEECETCLKNAAGILPTCCAGSRGARVLLASCNVRYELFPFYNVTSSSSLSSPPLPSPTSGKKKFGSGTIAMIVAIVVVFVILLCLGCYFHLRRRLRKKHKTIILKENFGNESASLESLQFNLATIEAATNKFSIQNKIGRGGFGEVYKGVLRDGRQVAVKKLSKNSGQGLVEFKNEVLLIAKLQHINLVALLGFCLEEEEKILIYEYVPNKSLDYFLFDFEKKRLLNWAQRYKIIIGIARAILYLHEHSRLKIIHRDIKPSNVLLDDNMEPKLSDFGLAKMINSTTLDQEETRTKRIAGTYGYMAPEYIKYGHFSNKSDVFSFGVIALEVVSARKNARNVNDLLNDAWKHWNDETPLEIMDPDVKEGCLQFEARKCIQIGLWCVQENPDERPTMAEVVPALCCPAAIVPHPGEPAFLMHTTSEREMQSEARESSSNNSNLSCSVNNLSVTNFLPR